MYGWSLDQPILTSWPFGFLFNCYFAFTTHHDTFSLCFSFEIPPSWFSFSFSAFFLHTDTPWTLILFNFGCWLWRLGASIPFRFGLEWQAWLATGVFRFFIAIEFDCFMVLFSHLSFPERQ